MVPLEWARPLTPMSFSSSTLFSGVAGSGPVSGLSVQVAMGEPDTLPVLSLLAPIWQLTLSLQDFLKLQPGHRDNETRIGIADHTGQSLSCNHSKSN